MPRRHFLAALLGAIIAAVPGGVAALCATPPVEAGTYVNTDPDTRAITRMTLRFRCGDMALNGTTVASHFRVRLWGSCSPEDCDWGTARAGQVGGTPPYVARYDQGFAKRRVEIHPLGRERARVVVRSSYSDDRGDRTTTDVLRQKQVSWEPGTNRPGGDFRNYAIENDAPGRCAEACERSPRCKAFTYVKPGLQGPKGQCWLKDAVPRARSDDCCVSGRK